MKHPINVLGTLMLKGKAIASRMSLHCNVK